MRTSESPLANIDASRLGGLGVDIFFELPAHDVLTPAPSPTREGSRTPEIRISHPSQEHDSSKTPVGHRRHIIARRSFETEPKLPEPQPPKADSSPYMMHQLESTSTPSLHAKSLTGNLATKPNNHDGLVDHSALTPPARLKTPVMEEESVLSNASHGTVIHHEQYERHDEEDVIPEQQPEKGSREVLLSPISSKATAIFSSSSSVYEDDQPSYRWGGSSHSHLHSKPDSGYESESSYQAARARFENAQNFIMPHGVTQSVDLERGDYKIGTVTSINMGKKAVQDPEQEVQPASGLRTMLATSPNKAESRGKPRPAGPWLQAGRPTSKLFGKTGNEVALSQSMVDDDDVFVDRPETSKPGPKKLQKRRPASGEATNDAALGIPEIPSDLVIRHSQRMKKHPGVENLRRAQVPYARTANILVDEPLKSSPNVVPIEFPSPYSSASKTPLTEIRQGREVQASPTKTPVHNFHKDTSFLLSAGQTPVEDEPPAAKHSQPDSPRKSPSFFRAFSRKSMQKKRKSDIEIEDEEEEASSNLADFENVKDMLGASHYDLAAANHSPIKVASNSSGDLVRDQAALDLARRRSRLEGSRDELDREVELEKRKEMLLERRLENEPRLDAAQLEQSPIPTLPTRSPARPSSSYESSRSHSYLHLIKEESSVSNQALREPAIEEVDELAVKSGRSRSTLVAEETQDHEQKNYKLDQRLHEQISIRDWAQDNASSVQPSSASVQSNAGAITADPAFSNAASRLLHVTARERPATTKTAKQAPPPTESNWETLAKLWRDRRKGASSLKKTDSDDNEHVAAAPHADPDRSRLDAALPPIPGAIAANAAHVDEASSAALFQRRKSVAEGHLRRPHNADLTRKESLEEFGIAFMQRRKSMREGQGQARRTNPPLQHISPPPATNAAYAAARRPSPSRFQEHMSDETLSLGGRFAAQHVHTIASTESPTREEQASQSRVVMMPPPSLPSLPYDTTMPPPPSPSPRAALPWATASATVTPVDQHSAPRTDNIAAAAAASPRGRSILAPLFRAARQQPHQLSHAQPRPASPAHVESPPRVSISPSPSVRERARVFEQAAEALIGASYVQQQQQAPSARSPSRSPWRRQVHEQQPQEEQARDRAQQHRQQEPVPAMRGVRSAHAPRREHGAADSGIGMMSLKSPRLGAWEGRIGGGGVGIRTGAAIVRDGPWR